MNLRHVALVCGSEENADRFFVRLLGLKKSEPKALPSALGEAIFGVGRELTIVNYVGDRVHFEIFIDARHSPRAGRVEHVCLEVDALPEFLCRCRDSGVEVIRVPKGDALITFIRDADGNLFEIKEREKA